MGYFAYALNTIIKSVYTLMSDRKKTPKDNNVKINLSMILERVTSAILFI